MNGRAFAIPLAAAGALAAWLVPQMSARAQSPANPHGPISIPCADCHTTSGWSVAADAPFDHTATGYRLEGQHASVACAACHADLRFAHVPTACADCHTDVHDADLGMDCARCHDTTSWDARAIEGDPHQSGSFPLVGPHAAADCESCHGDQPVDSFTATAVECWECHMASAAEVEDPNHMIAGFGADCERCHAPTMMRWSPSTYVHQLPLLGAHAALDCLECHSEQYTGTPMLCIGCHEPDLAEADDPPHDGFPDDCRLCHGQTAWEPADFDHGLVFPLIGAHATLECASCHDAGYAGTPTDCIGCHQGDFDGANDPPHTGFPVACETCHSQTAWEPADFDHDPFFPIDSGPHSDLADDCESCHVQPSSYAFFECILCHEHRQSETDGEHDDVADYVYESVACYDCHPDGRE